MLSFILVYCFPLQLVGIRKATRYIQDAAPFFLCSKRSYTMAYALSTLVETRQNKRIYMRRALCELFMSHFTSSSHPKIGDVFFLFLGFLFGYCFIKFFCNIIKVSL